jgi:hypothetical protein
MAHIRLVGAVFLLTIARRGCKIRQLTGGVTLSKPLSTSAEDTAFKNRLVDASNVSFFIYLILPIMSVYQGRGKWEIKWFRKVASTTISANTFVEESSATDTVHSANKFSSSLVGICMKTIAATDSDYADNTRIPVAVPLDASSEVVCSSGTGTLAVTDEGEFHDLTDAGTVDPTSSTYKLLKLKQFVSSTRGIYTINKKSIV